MYYVNINSSFQSLSVAIKGLIHHTTQEFTPRVGQTDADPSIIWHLVGSVSGGSFHEQLLETPQYSVFTALSPSLAQDLEHPSGRLKTWV